MKGLLTIEEILVHSVGKQLLANFDRCPTPLLYTLQLTAVQIERDLSLDIHMRKVSLLLHRN